jgi:hypothetical protein
MLCGIIGCSEGKIDQPMIVGEYEANHGLGKDVLEIRADGSYVLRYEPSGGSPFQNKGTWTFEYRDGEPRLTFSGFVFGPDELRTVKKPAFWDVVVQIHRKRLYLPIDADANYYYIKR